MVGKLAYQDCVDKAENGGVRADAKRQRQGRDDGEAGALRERSDAEPDIFQCVVNHAVRPRETRARDGPRLPRTGAGLLTGCWCVARLEGCSSGSFAATAPQRWRAAHAICPSLLTT